ncbi:hypothetical protein [Nocardia sp. NPDC050175]|uniref:hypothetical protein n=1 Tax=Nocardia sp. NPDC050175 TaxID=3364317 RepID=UPI0037B23AB0
MRYDKSIAMKWGMEMDVLLELAPRNAGATVVETDTIFDAPDPLHNLSACPASNICLDNTEICTVSYPPFSN